MIERSIQIAEKINGKFHKSVADGVNNLANIYKIQANYDKAIQLYLRSIEIEQKCSGPNSPNISVLQNNLGEIYYKQQKYVEAKNLYKQAL